MEELIGRSLRRNSSQEDQIFPQVRLNPGLAYNDLPPKVLKTLKSGLHDGAARPVNPLAVLENRVKEIYYQDIHALLPPPGAPPLPTGSGNDWIDDPRVLYGSGISAERQRHRSYVRPLPNKTTSVLTNVSPLDLLPPVTFRSIRFSRELPFGTEERRPKLPSLSSQTFEKKESSNNQ